MQFLYESEQIPGKEILRGSYIEKSQQVQEIPLTKYSWNTGEYMTEISYFLALFLLFPDTSVFSNRSLLPTLDTLTFRHIAPEVVIFSTHLDFLQLLQVFMQFIIYPTGHDLLFLPSLPSFYLMKHKLGILY